MTESDDVPAPSPSRRRFLRDVLAGSVAGGTMATASSGCRTTTADGAVATPSLDPLPEGAPEVVLDLRRDSLASQADRVVRSTCQFCNAACALDVGLEGDRVIEIRGVGSDPVQAGNLCVKAELMSELVQNSARLRTPMKRVGGAKGSPDSVFEPITWDEAFDVIATKLLEIRDSGQAHTVASKTTGRMPRGSGELIARFFELYGSPNATDVGPVCNDAGGNALAYTFGLGNFTNGYGVDPATGKEDLGSAELLLLFGTNQAETHPVTFSHLMRERRIRGARLVCIDPRSTPTTAAADQWIAPKPHTDLALALGMLGTILSEELYDRDFVERWVVGFDELVEHVAARGYSPQWASTRCDVPEQTIRELARAYATTKPASIMCNAGISHQLSAFTTYRTLAILAAVTGNIGIPGGGCNFMHNTWPGSLRLPAHAQKVPPLREGLPVGPDSFAESILEGKPYRLRAVFTAGNPMLASANSSRVREAFERLEFYVYTGLFREEPANYADVLLPVPSGLELDGVYMRRDDRAIRWQQAAVPRVGESRSDCEIWIGLAHAMARHDEKNPPSYWTDPLPREWMDYSTLWAQFVANTPGVGGMTKERMTGRDEPLRWPCPTQEHPGVSTLYLDHPSWYEAAAALGRSGERFLTPSGKVEIHTEALEQRFAGSGHGVLPTYFTHPEVVGATESIRYGDAIRNPIHPDTVTPRVELGVPSVRPEGYPLMGMIGRSSVVHFAGVTHWTFKGKRLDGVRRIQIHPSVAEAAGIAEGDAVIVQSPRGSIRGTARLWEDIRPDTIFVPNGFGWEQSVGDLVGAPRHLEAANALVSDRYFDSISGQQAYKCFACRVRKA